MTVKPLRWRAFDADMAAMKVKTECCRRMIVGADAIMATVSKEDQKRGQPPFRYRCNECGGTQDDFPMPLDALHTSRLTHALGANESNGEEK